MRAPTRGKLSEATLGAALVYLLPRLARSRRCPTWPPDLDAINGERLLEPPAGADARVLTIAPELREEWTGDGRRDGGIASFPVFREVRPVPP